MSSPVFQNMAPNARRSFLLTLALAAVAACIYLFAVQPAEEALQKAQKDHEEVDSRLRIVNANLKGAPENKARLEKLAEGLAPFRAEMLEPLLGSYAMRAKSVLEPLAFGAGLSSLDYEELPPRALPVPRPTPLQLHARRPVRITAKGSYMAAISFLMRVEKEHPLVALQSLSISTSNDPEMQQISMVFEWPAKGGKSK